MIDSDTLITYPDGATAGTGTVVHVERLPDDRWATVLDETSAHPVDPTWPDQGPDLGVLVVDGVRHELLDCRIGASQDGVLHVGDRLPERLGTPGWHFVVVHVLADPLPLGATVAVEIDASHREQLSRGHTACHLASLALNSAVADLWSKPARVDSLGRPDFDQAAIQSSVIRHAGSTDVYRLGKSLRRSGFDTARLRDELPAITERIDALLALWIGADAAVRIERADSLLSTRRSWRCDVTPGGDATIPCGGTHVTRLSDLGRVHVHLTLDDDGTGLRMETDAS